MMSRRRPAEGAARQKEAKAMNKAGSGPEETVDFFDFRNAFQLTYAEMAD